MWRGFGPRLLPFFGLPPLALGFLLIACAPAQSSQLPVQKATAQPVKPLGPQERLAQALRSIPRPEPVLAALPADARQRLSARLAGLTVERKVAVHRDDGPLVETLPLLHLESGGTSPRALYALATTPAGSQELSGILGLETAPSATSPDAARVAIVAEIARRAAFDFCATAPPT